MPQPLDQIVKDFEAAWNAGEQPNVAKFLGLVGEKERDELLARLLPIDIEQRDRAGASVVADDYAMLGSDGIDVAKQHLRELDSQGDQPSVSDSEDIDVTSPLAFAQTAPFDDSDSCQPPERIGRYRVERVLGKGGFGLVYLAHDEQLSRPVAIKVPHAHMLARPEDTELYVTEAQTVANLDHSNIVPVYDVGSTPETSFFIVSKFIEGSDLATLLKKSRLSHLQAAELVATVAEALHHAHKQRLVHRDIKPGNILIDHGGKPYVVDFGLALHEQDVGKRAGYIGTPSYMSPEQARGEGHRVDGRSDIFSLGVVFYELLLGRRPFRGDTKADLLTQIVAQEPRPPRQLDDSVAKELERICLKMLSKRASERYTTATDAAEDLRHFLTQETGDAVSSLAANLLSPAPITETNSKHGTPVATPTRASQQIRIVPKGLRSFDQHDADFFLELLPGPRDRDGLPESIRFWKSRIEETDPDNTFSVGLIYGPSGCGKSSLVKAGLLPRLSSAVSPIQVEATPEETESRLLNGLRRHCPGLPDDLTLKDTLAALRRGQGIAVGRKVLIVIDQFEQWLYSKQRNKASELVSALRQCDGEHVQCIVMVRDDFWMAATRFMRDLEVRLLEDQNSAAVDLFPTRHAEKVLIAFGRAFGTLSDNPSQLGDEQKAFVKQTVQGLADDDKVVCVRLALFAEMMKGKPWTPATLKEVGGTEGIGATFLEETFSASSAPPEHRFHQRAARAVLNALLPESGSDIKGHMKSYDSLLNSSGYTARPKDFEELVRILDGEIRLITPTDPEGLQAVDSVDPQATDQKYFQLTHDYLVPSLRDWLTKKQRETRKGRAELKLAERSVLWNAKSESRQLPSWWEWLSFLALTKPGRWRSTEKAMMLRATQRHALQSLLVVGSAILLGIFAYDRMAAVRADGLVEAVATSDSPDLPQAVQKLREYQRWTKPRLVDRLEANPQEPAQRVRLQLGLAAVGNPQVGELTERLLDAEPPMSLAIARVLKQNVVSQDLESHLWSVVAEDQQLASARVRASVALAQLAPENRPDEWRTNADSIAALLLRDISEHPGHFSTWVDALVPVRRWLVEPLRQISENASSSERERVLTANILAQYYGDDELQLVDLALRSTPKQFDIYSRTLEERITEPPANLLQFANTTVPVDASEDEKDRLARRQANAILLLNELGDSKYLWPSLQHSPDPRLRSYLVDTMGHLLARPERFEEQLFADNDAGIRQAVLLVLGNALSTVPSYELAPDLLRRLLHLFRDDPNSGVHSAVEWALRRLGYGDQIQKAINKLAELGQRPNFQWYVTRSGITMIIIEAPGQVTLGSPVTEPGRDTSDEHQWTCNVDWSFAVSATEITQAQFQAELPDYSKYQNDYAPSDLCPANAISWLDAVQFCRQLSERDGFSAAEMVVPSIEKLKKGPYPDFRTRQGYRLPIEAEWEIACRAGSVTPRFFGHDPDLLDSYSWYRGNSPEPTSNVGRTMPNGFGFFDMLGNVSELCFDIYLSHSESNESFQVPGFKPFGRYAARGNNSGSIARITRSANRRFVNTKETSYVRGFRIARTVKASPSNP